MGRGTQGPVKRRIGCFGWALRVFGGFVLVCLLAFGGFLVYFSLAVYPKVVAEHTAEAQKAQAFAKLSGAARRLAIYDAFVEQVDQHYYDQTFSGFDWPRMKRDWRPKAAAARDDSALYFDVFMQMTQRFPSSHVSAGLPEPKALPAPTKGAAPQGIQFGGYRDIGFQIADLRRRPGQAMIVGEVWPGSVAAKVGITPGWRINTLTFGVAPGGHADHVHVTGTFTRVTPAQMHELETMSNAQLFNTDPPLSKEAVQARMKSLQTSVDYDAKFTGADLAFVARRLPDGVLYIRFDHFDEPGLKQVITALHTADPRGVVLDLRYNNGGYVMPLLNALLPGNTQVYRTRNATGLHTISTGLWTRPYSGPLAVLTGPDSASAAEIAASVLKSRHRAVIVGRATNGSVLGSNVFPLPDGGQVTIPVEDIEMLDGKRLENAGVVPDIEVYPSLDDVRQGRDPALEIAERRLAGLSGR